LGVADQDWVGLQAHDQLLKERSAGNVFRLFREGVVTFPPTYKYQPGTLQYERRADHKQRCPAWCDRVLWLGHDVHQVFYNRAELTGSDHLPVYAAFDAKVRHTHVGRQERE
jgi:hypothetical protein